MLVLSLILQVNLPAATYPVYVGSRILSRLGELVAGLGNDRSRRVMLVSNPLVDRLYGDNVRRSLQEAGLEPLTCLIPDGEEQKNLATVARLYDFALAVGLERINPVIALGGGVTGDTTGFFAATYMRGIPFVQVPTTLLAQIDSSIGGKVGVNHPRAKNLIGAFYQPDLVLADTAVLTSLPEREFVSGLAEAVKCAVLAGEEELRWLEENAVAVKQRDEQVLTQLVAMCCRLKISVVEKDEREAGLRAILNLGHTVGHALESATAYRRFLHGEAVAMGLVVAARLAELRGGTQGLAERLVRLLSILGLPVALPPEYTGAKGLNILLPHMRRDKKIRGGRLVMILPMAAGKTVMVDDISVDELLAVLT